MSTIRNLNKTMDNLDKLSDDELRRRLLQYGFPNVPVTSNTRKILIKKLRNHMETEKTKLRRETTNVARYSSGEESDGGGLINRERYRVTISTANPSRTMMPPPTSPGLSIKSRNSMTTSNVSPPPKPNIYVSDTIQSETDEDDDDYMNNSTSTRISSPLGSLQSRYNTSNGNSNNTSNNDNVPYLNDFTTRLLKLRGETVKSELLKNNVPSTSAYSSSSNSTTSPYMRSNRLISNNDIVHHVPVKYQPMARPSPNQSRWSFRNLLRKLDNNYGIKQPLVPYLLVSGLVLFLTVVIFIYLIISPDIVNNLNDKTTNYQLCSNIDTSDNCIQTELQLQSSLDLLKIIVPELESRSISKLCNTNAANSNDFLTKNDIIKLLIDKNSQINISTILNDLKNIEHLILMNPQWHLNYNNKLNYFNIIKPKLPLICILKIKLHKFFIIIGCITIIFITIYLIQFIIRFFIRVRQSRKDKLNNLMNDIIGNVSELTAAQTEGNSKIIVVNHLRDKLIPVDKRREMEKVWNEAIKLLEQNESRLQFDIHMINGEECKVIKWIDTITPISNNNNNNRSMIKKWQSPAFDKTNKIKDPPTPCLKIRQMFDKYEANDKNLKTIIQDSILEKVGNNCQIYDIQLDTNTCCVYVRCATPYDAGIVHDEINGWWFDNRLVSIKFVRVERYISRFPKSLSGPVCLRPSNTKKLSISNCELQNQSPIDDDDDLDDDDDNSNNLNN